MLSRSQRDVIRTLGQLTDAGLVQVEAVPDVRQIVVRSQQRLRREKRTRPNLLFLRLFSFDPSAMLERLSPRVRCVLTPKAFMVWGAVVMAFLLGARFNGP